VDPAAARPAREPGRGGLVDTLWYLRTYVWFLLLSPLLLRAFRRAPWTSVVTPLALLPVVALAGHGWPGHGEITAALMYGRAGCSASPTTTAAGRVRSWSRTAWSGWVRWRSWGWYWSSRSVTRPIRDTSISATASGRVLRAVLLDGSRGWTGWPGAGLRRAVAVMNARAVTVYLWHDAAIVAAGLAVGALACPRPCGCR
jgi:hypothetical protein